MTAQLHKLIDVTTEEERSDGETVKVAFMNEYVKIVEIVWPLPDAHIDSGYITIERLSGWHYLVMPEVICAKFVPLEGE